MNAIRLFAALLVLGLGGCANYPMGSLKTDLLPAEDVAASYSLNTAWWKGYHDADLDRIVALALERNVDLALSAIKVNRALYQARLLSADLVPSFSANASAAALRHGRNLSTWPSVATCMNFTRIYSTARISTRWP